MFLIFALALYAWRDWFISLCGLIVLSALMGHPDMPTAVLGIPGLNPWNFLFICILIPWFANRRMHPKRGDLPPWVSRLFGLYLVVVVVAYLRAVADVRSFTTNREPDGILEDFSSLTIDYFINSLKYIAPAVLLYDGLRSRKRFYQGLIASLMLSVLMSASILRAIPLTSLGESGKREHRQRMRIGKQVGFHANSAARICVAGFWGTLAIWGLSKRKWHRISILGAAALPFLGMALCKSRAGYIAFAGVGVIYAVFLWRYLLIALPVGVVVVFTVFPGIPERLMEGFGIIDPAGEVQEDMDAVTAGRTTEIWPPVIAQIKESPIFGYGRLGILRTPVRAQLATAIKRCPGHPHNAYLELLLDMGVIGFAVVLTMFGSVFWISLSLARDRRDPMFRAVGAAALAAVSALLIMSLSGQSMFSKENSQMEWCLYAIALRVWIERRNWLMHSRQQAPQTAGAW